MSQKSQHRFPLLHNAMWPGLVGKGLGAEPPLSFDTMLELTAAAEVDGVRFDGIDLILTAPHVDINSTEDDLKRLTDKIAAEELSVGSLVAPVWSDLGGGSAMGSAEENARFLAQIEKSCRIGQSLRRLGIRSAGVIRIDSAAPPAEWVRNPEENTKRIAHTFREACSIAEGYGERLAAEGEICWAGMHTWRRVVDLLELVGRPEVLGFQADMAHTMLFTLGYNAPEDRLLPEDFVWSEQELFAKAIEKMADALRPWTTDFHVAQNDGTVKGSGAHDRTGRHCLPNDPEGRMNIVRDAGAWMRDDSGQLTKAFRHICWDGCMFSNDVMLDSRTWNDVLGTMMKVRAAHGWD